LINSSSKDKSIAESGSTFREITRSGLEDISELVCPVLSNAAIRDELAFQLGSAVTCDITDNGMISIDHKYSILANYVLYRMCIWISPPVFVINTSDLSQLLYRELEQLKKCDPKGFDRTVTEAVQLLMEGMNERYYHISGVAYKFIWRFEP
jgi:hypothetical protein